MEECRDCRKYNQLLDGEKILLSAIQVVRKARSYGSGEFFPEQITGEKKLQILKQYNNMNDKLQ